MTIDARTTAAIVGHRPSATSRPCPAIKLDPNPANNQTTATITVSPLVDLKLTKVASNPTPAAGGTVSYTLTLINNGPSPATGVTLTDPAAQRPLVPIRERRPGQLQRLRPNGHLPLGTLAAGGSRGRVTMTVLVAASAPAPVSQNTATATADEPIARPELLTRARGSNPGQPRIRPPPRPTSPIPRRSSPQRPGEPASRSTTRSPSPTMGRPRPPESDRHRCFSKSVELVSARPGGSCSIRHPITCKLGSIAAGHSDTIQSWPSPTRPGFDQLRQSHLVDPRPEHQQRRRTRHPDQARAGHAVDDEVAGRRTVAPGQTLSFTITVRSLGPEPALRSRSATGLDQG